MTRTYKFELYPVAGTGTTKPQYVYLTAEALVSYLAARRTSMTLRCWSQHKDCPVPYQAFVCPHLDRPGVRVL